MSKYNEIGKEQKKGQFYSEEKIEVKKCLYIQL